MNCEYLNIRLMAKQAGPIFLTGTIRDVNYYYREGEALARSAGGGFTRQNIKESPNMEAVRQSNSEFAHCSKVNKAFKLAMQPYLSGYKDGTFHYRLMQLFLKIKDCDLIMQPGKRSVSAGIRTASGQQLIRSFTFTPGLAPLFPGSYELDWDPPVLTVSDFNVADMQFPTDADFMEVQVGLLRFDFDHLRWTHVLAEPLLITRDFREGGFTIQCPEVPAGGGMVFSVVGVFFYRRVNGVLAEDTAHREVRIVSVREGEV